VAASVAWVHSAKGQSRLVVQAALVAAVLSLAALAEMRAAIHSETSDFTNAMRLSPSGTAAQKRPSARYRLSMVRDSEVSSQARFMLTSIGSSADGFMVFMVGIDFGQMPVPVPEGSSAASRKPAPAGKKASPGRR
jgi:hypothetical protein